MKGFGTLLGKRKKVALSVYMTDKVLRVLGLDRAKRPLFDPIEVFWENESYEEKVKILSRVVETNGLKGEKVISCIPANEGILKLHRFPTAMTKKDLMEAIEWQVRTETQKIKEETIHDYYFLEESDEKYVRVVMIIARGSSVKRLTEILEKAGLKPEVVDYEINAIINFGLYNRLSSPFSILYVDYHEGVLTYYSKDSISYNKTDFNYLLYRETKDNQLLNAFLVDIRNQLVINEISNIYLAGPIISDESTLETVMTSLPVMGILDLERVSPAFFIPFILSVRYMEE
ncbi:MAG TPA: pilus assembly protein PilM [Aquifex aeolicus]|nr:pilus assembly protein PilM [Aquifex aeolicus]